MISRYPGLFIQSSFILDYVDNGLLFQFSKIFTSVANNGTSDILFIPGASKNSHTAFLVSASGDCTVDIYEAPTVSANGTSLTIYNYNRTSGNTATSTAFHTPTVTSTGTTDIFSGFISGGRGNQGSGGFITQVGSVETILTANTKYLMRLTNVSGNSATVWGAMVFYERS